MDFAIRFLILSLITAVTLFVASEKWAKHNAWFMIAFILLISAYLIYQFYIYNTKHRLIQTLPDEISSMKEYKIYYNEHSRILTKPYDGVIDALKRLRQKGIMTAVVSNKPDMTVKGLCELYFDGLVDFSVGDRPDIKRKPAADPIYFAMERLGCDKAVYVGDSEVDVLAAKNAGLPCVSVTWGFRDRDVLEECGADIFADRSEELLNKLYELLGVDGECDATC